MICHHMRLVCKCGTVISQCRCIEQKKDIEDGNLCIKCQKIRDSKPIKTDRSKNNANKT